MNRLYQSDVINSFVFVDFWFQFSPTESFRNVSLTRSIGFKHRTHVDRIVFQKVRGLHVHHQQQTTTAATNNGDNIKNNKQEQATATMSVFLNAAHSFDYRLER